MIDHARLNGPTPPEVLDAIDVDMYALNHSRVTGPPLPAGASRGILEFRWHRPDGRELLYRRWTDEDGERFYLPDEFERRAVR